MKLYPRLALSRARALAEDLGQRSAEELPVSWRAALGNARFAPTGGTRVSGDELGAFGDGLHALAVNAGWPKAGLAAQQQFDREAACWLAGQPLPLGEALRAEVWAWVAIRLVPHLVQWRFGSPGKPTNPERFAGSVQRNALGRLWLRGWALDLGEGAPERWSLVNSISEDAAVAIFERPTIGSQPRLARCVAQCWLTAKNKGIRDAEGLLRDAAKRLLILCVLRDLGTLDDPELRVVVERVFDAALAARAMALAPATTLKPANEDGHARR